ncbi:MAG: hypothetical protein V1894_02160 [Chloroflexota bacterium]
MARDRNQRDPAQAEAVDINQLRRRLDMLDSRLDNIDSMVSAVVERVMNQVVTLNLICPRCGKEIEVGVIGTKKPTA